ncbi:MAG: glycine dehydrogenase (aminomethyl-transferring) [Myxococcales bacterium]|nr:glycine dehydrogenase (aminomethyl-transferring) [Myxococcales bacterium]
MNIEHQNYKKVSTHPDRFVQRHIGPRPSDIKAMIAQTQASSLDALIDEIVPESIRRRRSLSLPEAKSEFEVLEQLKEIGTQNKVYRSLIGQGYYSCYTPPVIQRNILENPGWYTQYTPYQAEISQGRLEALVNYQTVITDLTGLSLANSSLLDESTAAAEAMGMCWSLGRQKGTRFIVDTACHPQTIAVLQTRAEPLGIDIVLSTREDMLNQSEFEKAGSFGVIVQYPDTHGITDEKLGEIIDEAHAHKVKVVVASDLLALTLLTPPGELGEQGADIVVGSSQRFGVPFGAGGPHAAFMSTHAGNKRFMPGRIIGLSVGSNGEKAYRLALQTREQHIRRDKATSNICTAQVLLAVMAGMYAVYHGAEGLKAIALRVKKLTATLEQALEQGGTQIVSGQRFDTIVVTKATNNQSLDAIYESALQNQINLRKLEVNGQLALGISLDETCDFELINQLVQLFLGQDTLPKFATDYAFSGVLNRQSVYLDHPSFQLYHCEHELLRYMHRLQAKDLSLTHSMIPLGSCTMKLNATAEMIAVTWPEFAHIHPFAPIAQRKGYAELHSLLEGWLEEITGFSAISLQPNAGSQGEYAGLLVIRAYHLSRGDTHRKVCLIPTSAHGTNPASAVMAGFKVVPVKCDERGDIDLTDLEEKSVKHAKNLGALMITYPSTHGVFEEGVVRACAIVHAHGGQVYMDGANMNAQVGLCRPGDIGADVCHLNLHKTFCIPHGGGGPGMGPIGVATHLAPFLPTHPEERVGGDMHIEGEKSQAIGPVSAAPFGSPSILPISFAYISMMGPDGLRYATEIAILNANYMASRLQDHYDVLYTGHNGRVAHEFILDCRGFKATADISVDDIAKRLMDYGFHAPTMSWPVTGTLMVEPTESESKEELDRFCEAMIAIREEIKAIETGLLDREDNPLHHAPHTVEVVTADEWNHTYSRSQAAYPLKWIKSRKFWPSVGRVDNAYGDRNLVCTCPPMEDYED